MAWHVGNLEPTVPGTGIYLTMTFDGRAVGSLIRGSTHGVWNDAAQTIFATVDCPQGTHRLSVTIDGFGHWGIPYAANPGEQAQRVVVNRGFVVTEIWGT